MSSPNPNHITRQQLAALIGAKAPSYINELEKTGRALRAPDGKLWLKDESLAAYRAGRDPSKQGVADRHAAAREAAPGAPAAPAAPATAQQAGDEELEDHSGYSYQNSKAKREFYAAEREQDAFRKEAGQLMERSAVIAVFAEAGTTLRSRLEAWQTTLPPQLAGQDEATIRITLADQVERMLLDLVETFNRLAGEGA